MQQLEKIGVLGAGMMGAEIGLCFAISGRTVVLKESSVELSESGKARLGGVLDKAIKKGNIQDQDKTVILSKIIPTDQYDLFRDVDLIVEAVFEDLGVKTEVFSELDSICMPECVFATNTSSIPITLLATTVKPQRRPLFVGAHFFSPASVMKLVEIIPGVETAEDTVKFMTDSCRIIGKTPIRVKDVAGFAVNRILQAIWIEANRLVEEGVATFEDIDTACKLGLGHPIGPYTLMDLTGNDLNLKVAEILHEAYGARFRPRPLLKQKVYANHLGRKTGRGWYKY